MTDARLICLTLVILCCLSAHRQAKAYSAEACFDGKNLIFNQVKDLKGSSSESVKMLEPTCEELDIPGFYDSSSPLDLANNAFQQIGFVITGDLLAAFDRMSSSGTQIDFKRKLEEIKKDPVAISRIRQTYQLVARSQGSYDEKYRGTRTLLRGWMVGGHTPSNELDSVNAYGSVGVCREMATLLNWSLRQVARHSGSLSMGLAPGDFSTDIIFGELPSQGEMVGHSWVRVHLPIFSKSGLLQDFEDIDLDTTVFPYEFSILIPRRSGLSETERRTLSNECHAISSCLSAQIGSQ